MKFLSLRGLVRVGDEKLTVVVVLRRHLCGVVCDVALYAAGEECGGWSGWGEEDRRAAVGRVGVERRGWALEKRGLMLCRVVRRRKTKGSFWCWSLMIPIAPICIVPRAFSSIEHSMFSICTAVACGLAKSTVGS